MLVKEIIKLGDPILRKVCTPVEDFSVLPEIVEEMFDSMYEADGIGLAANQVNLDMHLFVAHVPGEEDDDGEQKVFVNGKIISCDGESAYAEGCLSIPGIQFEVMRPETITLEYQDIDGTQHTETFEGLLARAIQHELDHLNGMLITDRVSNIQKLQYKQDLKEIEKQALLRFSERNSNSV